MVHDSIINVSASTKDFPKKKRANRSAKLKQCKLDARREQWLSQGKNKVSKEETNSNGGEEHRKAKVLAPCCKELEVRSVIVQEIHNQDSDSETLSPANSPLSIVPGCGNNYAGSSSNISTCSNASTASFGSGDCCSGNITEEEECGGGEFGDDDDGCLDDWEAVADALVGASTDDNQGHDPSGDQNPHEEDATLNSDSASQGISDASVDTQGKLDSVGILGRGGANNKAWRPDDASRPPCLPNLAKHRSFPTNSERLSCHGLNPWGRRPPCVPMSCPICCEDLDLTDSSFLPCPCGFHLCLFCHKRILEGDGRCPGCRKPYELDTMVKETSVGLARSSSMFSRV